MTSKKDEYKHLPLVPESVLKRRHDLDDIRRRKDVRYFVEHTFFLAPKSEKQML